MIDPNLRDYVLLKHMELTEAKYDFEIHALNWLLLCHFVTGYLIHVLLTQPAILALSLNCGGITEAITGILTKLWYLSCSIYKNNGSAYLALLIQGLFMIFISHIQ